MTVEPGFGGQAFMSGMMPRVSAVREAISRKRLRCALEVDGGINPVTAVTAVQAGADVLVAGNSIFGEPDAGRALKKLKAATGA
jgi:ribulose-phosphate 3-epimerase